MLGLSKTQTKASLPDIVGGIGRASPDSSLAGLGARFTCFV
jgi:hypothetical protein